MKERTILLLLALALLLSGIQLGWIIKGELVKKDMPKIEKIYHEYDLFYTESGTDTIPSDSIYEYYKKAYYKQLNK